MGKLGKGLIYQKTNEIAGFKENMAKTRKSTGI